MQGDPRLSQLPSRNPPALVVPPTSDSHGAWLSNRSSEDANHHHLPSWLFSAAAGTCPAAAAGAYDFHRNFREEDQFLVGRLSRVRVTFFLSSVSFGACSGASAPGLGGNRYLVRAYTKGRKRVLQYSRIINRR